MSREHSNRVDTLQASTDKTDGRQPLSVLSVAAAGPTGLAERLLADLRAVGLTLMLHGDSIRYSPRTAMTPALRARIARHKGELLALLRSRPPLDPTYWDSVRYPTASLTRIVEERPCRCCFGTRWWRLPGRDWICIRCHPPMSAEIEVRDA